MKAQHFINIWKKAGKMKCRLVSKVKQRGVEPTYENCKDYYLGMIKPYRDIRGNVTYLHKKKDRKIIWRMKNDGRKQHIPRQNKYKKRRPR
tara:strand:+ start:220 stop:492 length:273 start_codon:yes stop_codon:yes gene_type:complete